MTVCYFGIYNPEYSRNKILIKGLRKNEVEILECRSDKKGIFKYFELIKKHWVIRNNYDVMIVGFPGHQAMILAKFLTAKPIIFDAFVSIYDSMVFDRKLAKKRSLKSLYFWCLDKISMELADLVLFDTFEHIKYASKEFNIPENKFVRIFVGADTDIFYPRNKLNKNTSNFKVLFFGKYIPLQGVEYIVRAAKLLEREKDIVFELIGNGQEKERILKLVKSLDIKNVIIINNISLKELADRIAMADVCLGIFGNTEKTNRVIPNKVYECAAMRKPIITADTKAIRELFNEGEFFLVETANPDLITDAIIRLKGGKESSEKLAKGAYKKFTEKATPIILGAELKNIINHLK